VNTLINRKTQFIDLDLIDYKAAWDYQTQLFNQILAVKSENRNSPANDQKPTDNFLIFCEHPHVFTLGKTGEEKNLLVKKEDLHSIQATYYQTNRGGDFTYHGPGQIVVYPVIDLENFFTDIHQYMRLLEESVIQTLSEFGINSGRIAGLTGVWLGADNPYLARKICALGVKTSRWVTLHGLALNVNVDLAYFNNIVPCGINDKQVTSLQKETGIKQELSNVKNILLGKFVSVMNMELLK